MSERRQALTLTDIATLAEVGVSAASNWRKRHVDFPQSTVVSGQELFAADQVAQWLAQRKIPRNGLQPNEAPGTTYGDRFMRNGGMITSGQIEAHATAELLPDWSNQLWQIMDLLRSDLEIGQARDFIMDMLYLRTTDRHLWSAVAEQRSWRDMNYMVRQKDSQGSGISLFAAAISYPSGEQKLVEAVRRFDAIDLDRAAPSAIFDALMESVNRDLGRHGGHFTPSTIVKCMIDILDPQSTDTVYDPSCGSGELLVAAARHGVKSISGQAMNSRSLRMALLNLSMHDSTADLRIGGPGLMRGPFADARFDTILSNPPFNMTLQDHFEDEFWPFGVPTKRDSAFAWLQIAVNKLAPGGRAGVLMPNGTLFSGGVSAEIRQAMVEAGVVECIVSLPAGLFTGTGIPVSLWLVRRVEADKRATSELLFIDATSMGVMAGRTQRVLRDDELEKIVRTYRGWRNSARVDSPDSSVMLARSVGLEQIRRNDYILQPQRYVREQTDSPSLLAKAQLAKIESMQEKLAELGELVKQTRRDVDARLMALRDVAVREWRKVPLGDICGIQVGPGAVDRERGMTVQGWIPLVLPRNIKRGYLSHDELDTVSPEISMKLTNYRLRPGDIVCARSGTLGRHGLVRAGEDGWFMGPSCMRLRPDTDSVVPEYLVYYLNSPETHAWISSASSGSTAIPHISAATMRELVVPMPSVAVQRDIAALMDSIEVNIEQYEQGSSTVRWLRDLVFPSLGA